MGGWLEHHRISEREAALAELHGRQGREQQASEGYSKAAAAESEALKALDPEKTRTYGITAVSLVALHVKAGERDAASAVIERHIGDPLLPEFARVQLADAQQDMTQRRNEDQ